MKQLKYFLLVAAVALSVVGCRKTINVSFENATQKFDAQGGSIELALKSNGEWTISSTEEWISITPMSGNGDATLTLAAQANNTGEQRSAEITATTKDNTAVLTVTQNAMEYYINVAPQEIQCGADGGEFTVTVSSNMEWVVSLPQWITSSVTQGSNDATVTLIVSPLSNELEMESRMADVFFGKPFSGAGQISLTDKVHVVQTVEPVLGIELTPNTLDFVCTGETKNVSVATEDGWTATVDDDWVTLSQTEGQGAAEISVTVEENPDYFGRVSMVHFVTVGGVEATLAIRQEATPDPHYLEVSPLEIEFGKEGGEREITIGCDADWVIALDCDWLSLSQPEGIGDATVVLTAEQNGFNEPRSMVFSVKSGMLSYVVTVNQAPGDTPVVLVLEPDTLVVAFTGGIEHVQLTSNTTWQIQTSSWILIYTATSGSGDASFDIIVDSYTDTEDRIGFVKALHDGQVIATLIVVQEGKHNILETNATYIDVRPEGGEFVVQVTANQAWRLAPSADWIHCNPSGGFANGSFTITVDPLPSSDSRTGKIKVIGSMDAIVEIIVNQH